MCFFRQITRCRFFFFLFSASSSQQIFGTTDWLIGHWRLWAPAKWALSSERLCKPAGRFSPYPCFFRQPRPKAIDFKSRSLAISVTYFCWNIEAVSANNCPILPVFDRKSTDLRSWSHHLSNFADGPKPNVLMLSLAVLNKIQLFFFLLSSFLEKILKFQIMSFNFEDRHFFFSSNRAVWVLFLSFLRLHLGKSSDDWTAKCSTPELSTWALARSDGQVSPSPCFGQHRPLSLNRARLLLEWKDT